MQYMVIILRANLRESIGQDCTLQRSPIACSGRRKLENWVTVVFGVYARVAWDAALKWRTLARHKNGNQKKTGPQASEEIDSRRRGAQSKTVVKTARDASVPEWAAGQSMRATGARDEARDGLVSDRRATDRNWKNDETEKPSVSGTQRARSGRPDPALECLASNARI
jgi:hypothetical protein